MKFNNIIRETIVYTELTPEEFKTVVSDKFLPKTKPKFELGQLVYKTYKDSYFLYVITGIAVFASRSNQNLQEWSYTLKDMSRHTNEFAYEDEILAYDGDEANAS